MNDDLLASPPLDVTSRFQLAAARIADGWLRTRTLQVSHADFRIAREFLQRDGWRVDEVPGARVRLTHPGFSGETTREEAVVVALRRLVASGEGIAVPPSGRRPGSAPRSAALRAPVSFRVSVPASTGEDACRAESPASRP